MVLFNAGGSFFYYKENYGIINDYYQNIVRIIQAILLNNPMMHVNIILCDKYDFKNSNKTINILFIILFFIIIYK